MEMREFFFKTKRRWNVVGSWENMSSWSGQSEGKVSLRSGRKSREESQLSARWGGSSDKKAKTGLSWQALSELHTSVPRYYGKKFFKILVGYRHCYSDITQIIQKWRFGQSCHVKHETLKRDDRVAAEICERETCLWSMKTKSRKKRQEQKK